MTTETTPETLRLAELGAQALDDHLPSCCKRAAAIRSLIAHATEMQAVMKAKVRPDKPGWYVWGNSTYPWIVRRVISNEFEGCKPDAAWFGPFNFALTETPRPATTGEGMGEK